MSDVHDHHGGADARNDGLDIADIFRRHGATAHERHQFTGAQLLVMRRVSTCRTAALGGHVDACGVCGLKRPSYNSCRDRHCPKCQSPRQAQWVAVRLARMLPIPHFHVVFTLPGRLRPVVRANRRELYDILFSAASETLMEFGRDPKWMGGQLGVTAVLHTWTRDLQFHPHLHCVVTGGGLSLDGKQWMPCTQGAKYLFPVDALGQVFRAKFVAALKKLDANARERAGMTDEVRFARYVDYLSRINWNVHVEPPFSTSHHVFKYLGYYTHRVGISNHRLVAVDDTGIRFKTKDGKTTCIPPIEFIRRFLDHVLPDGFVKIRHYGLYSGTHTKGRLAQARALLPAEKNPPKPMTVTTPSGKLKAVDWRTLFTTMTGRDPLLCPQCQLGTMQHVEILLPTLARGPP